MDSPTQHLSIQNLCIDSADPARLADFWQAALGWRRTDLNDDEVVLRPPEGAAPAGGAAPTLLFLRVPEEKAAVKNRLHLDLRPVEQGADVARLEALGATRADVGQTAEDTWVVLADPDGNEFCVLSTPRPRTGSAPAPE